MLKKRALLIGLLALCLAPLRAGAQEVPSLGLPLACKPGVDCWLTSFVDNDARPGTAQDFQCGPLTYDGNEGIDIAVRDLLALETGVNTLAAAAGTVIHARGTEPETLPTPPADAANKKGCGNGVILDHGGGWQTAYCHLKQDSLKVKKGDKVEAGAIIGALGSSGGVTYPHLHFSVFHDGKTIDPYVGQTPGEGCVASNAPGLWAPGVAAPYEPITLYASGFTTGAPMFEQLRIDVNPAQTLKSDVGSIHYWTAFYGIAAGDKIHMEITDPLGRVIATRAVIETETLPRRFYFLGKNAGAHGLPPGQYRGTARVERALGPGGAPISRAGEARVTLEP